MTTPANLGPGSTLALAVIPGDGIGQEVTAEALKVLDGKKGTDAAVALCDVSGVEPDAVTVDALARLQLAARRYGCQVRLRNGSRELLELVDFMGLTDVLPERRER
jgi:ABC-type transporter Mla MlaB component